MEFIVTWETLVVLRVFVVASCIFFVSYSYNTWKKEQREKQLGQTEGNIKILTAMAALIPLGTYILSFFKAAKKRNESIRLD